MPIIMSRSLVMMKYPHIAQSISPQHGWILTLYYVFIFNNITVIIKVPYLIMNMKIHHHVALKIYKGKGHT